MLRFGGKIGCLGVAFCGLRVYNVENKEVEMKLYKLTDQNYETKNHTKWGPGVTHKVKGCKHPNLCSEDVLHAYKSKELALLLNPIHANVIDPVIWEAKGNVVAEDWGKIGVFELTTTHMMRLPKWYRDTNTRRRVQVMFAILCAEAVLCHYTDKYPDDKRVEEAIKAAREYLKTGNNAYAYAAYDAAAYAAYTADAARADAYAYDAARAAAYAAYAAYDADAADAAYTADAARAAAAAADAADAARAAAAAADAAYTADAAADALDFNAIAKQAVREITVLPVAKTP